MCCFVQEKQFEHDRISRIFAHAKKNKRVKFAWRLCDERGVPHCSDRITVCAEKTIRLSDSMPGFFGICIPSYPTRVATALVRLDLSSCWHGGSRRPCIRKTE